MYIVPSFQWPHTIKKHVGYRVYSTTGSAKYGGSGSGYLFGIFLGHHRTLSTFLNRRSVAAALLLDALTARGYRRIFRTRTVAY